MQFTSFYNFHTRTDRVFDSISERLAGITAVTQDIDNTGQGILIVLNAQSSNSGNNLITEENLLVRAVDEGQKIYWLYDGRLTRLTDSDVGIKD